MLLHVKNIIEDEYAIDTFDGRKMYQELLKYVNQNKTITISFEEIESTSTTFLNESLGKLTLNYPEFINNYIEFDYPEGDILIKAKVESSIENAKLNEIYDQMIDNTILTL